MKHLAIIADGNRRWSAKNNLPISAGYGQALVVIENCCDWAIDKGIKFLTFYCFSTENWKRPSEEISLLMELARDYFREQKDWYVKKGIKVQFIGRRDRTPMDLLQNSIDLERATCECNNLVLNICLDYGGREEIIRAIASGATTEEEINKILTFYAPEPDLILRTGGQKRLSNFLLWQSAYAELSFVDEYFPELNENLLNNILVDFQSRKRNYGA